VEESVVFQLKVGMWILRMVHNHAQNHLLQQSIEVCLLFEFHHSNVSLLMFELDGKTYAISLIFYSIAKNLSIHSALFLLEKVDRGTIQ